ncbi:hypothetical protein [Streptomyces sp. V3I7]|uniref:hypothetical protein n=1 Tax=Streptomyces sp. V3I7 TaxID=3042278 RepID=UPI0027D7E2B4|nr:hypothetical protein [Streptomyces sp. V3I7]
MANLDARGLLRGLAAAWPQGIPQRGVAMDIHYLEQLGVTSTPHDEWVAWLHHCAVGRGDEQLARSIVAESGVTLPWRTVWSNCRPFGTFGPFSKQAPARPYASPKAAPGGQDLAGLLAASDSWEFPELAPPVRPVRC